MGSKEGDTDTSSFSRDIEELISLVYAETLTKSTNPTVEKAKVTLTADVLLTGETRQAQAVRKAGELRLAASTTNKPKLEDLIGATAGEIGIDPAASLVPTGTGGGGETETEEQRNKFLVLRLYEALNGRDPTAVQSLLAPDLEWWFHGPPKHQHMMRILTGDSTGNAAFRFVPRSVTAFGSTVIAEGGDQGTTKGDVYWVHAWTVRPEDGVITQLREYFNTDLTVTRLAAAAAKQCVWQSRRPDSATNSLPGLVLAL